LSGCLKAAPRSDREEGFNKDDYPLLPVRVETWGPFVFVNADRSAQPLSYYLGKLPQLLAQNDLDLSQLQFRQRREWQREANWKVAIENYLECYHCPVAHPGFSSVIDVDPDAYVLQAYEWFSSQSRPCLRAAGKVNAAVQRKRARSSGSILPPVAELRSISIPDIRTCR
jgi:choline monooxygenase